MHDEIEYVALAFYQTSEEARGWEREPQLLKQAFRRKAKLVIETLDGLRSRSPVMVKPAASPLVAPSQSSDPFLPRSWDPAEFVAVVEGPKHIFRMSNKPHNRLTGHRALIGKSVREAAPEVEGQGYSEMLDQVYETGQACFGRRTPLRIRTRRGGLVENCVIDFSYKPIIGVGGERIGVLMEGRDVTGLTQLSP